MAVPTYRIFCFGSGAGSALGVDSDGRNRRLCLTPVPLFLQNDDRDGNSNGGKGPNPPPRKVAAGDRVSSFVTEEGECYTWGRVARDLEQPIFISRIAIGPANNSSNSHRVKEICHGPKHTVALTTKGAFIWNDKSRRAIPREITGADPVEHYKDVGCGENQTLLLRDDGLAIYEHTTGNGNGHSKKPPIQAIHIGVKISSLDCGAHHSAAASDTGQLYTWGWGDYGRLGHGDEELRDSPELVAALAEQGLNVDTVACGAAHTCVVATRGDGGAGGGGESIVLGFGWNAYGQVSSFDMDRFLFPHQVFVTSQAQVASLSCGFGHNAAVTSNGQLYSWGFNGEGQLGLGHEDNVDTPTLVPVVYGLGEDESCRCALTVACGHLHTVCLASNYSPTEIEAYEQGVKVKERSKKILLRFARFVLLRARLRQYRKDSIIVESPRHDESSMICDNSRCASDDSDISSGGCTDINDSVDEESCEIRANSLLLGDEAIRQHQEMMAMAREDERVALHRSEEEARARAEAEEARILKELNRMKAEDEAARLLKSAEERKLKEAKHTRARQRLKDRNARVNASIQREANRLKEARQRQEQQATAKMNLPRMRRRKAAPVGTCTNPIQRAKSRKEKRDAGHTGLGVVIQAPCSERNHSLLERRRARLEEQQRIEEEQRRKRQQELEKARQIEDNRRRLIEREKERLERERKIRVDRNLEELKEKLGLGSNTATRLPNRETRTNKEVGDQRRFTFMSTVQWSKSLSIKDRR